MKSRFVGFMDKVGFISFVFGYLVICGKLFDYFGYDFRFIIEKINFFLRVLSLNFG